MRPALLLLILFLMIVLGMSCSKNGGVLPDANGTSIPEIASLPILVSDFDSRGNPTGGWGVLGLFNIQGKPSTGNFSIESLRSGALYDALEVVDITNFMTLAPCTYCVKVHSVQLNNDNTVTLKISIRHPFAVGDPMKPITGRNRADLHIFNVEGIVAATPDTEMPVSFPGLGQTVGHSNLINADGYTAYLDQSLDSIIDTQATIHPYKLHFRDYSSGNFDPSSPTGFTDVLHPTGNLVMAMGSDLDMRDYIFQLDNTDRLDFIYAVGCTYALSAASKSQRFTPEYRIPQHNKKAASEVHVVIDSNNLRGGVATSDCTIHVEVLDMSHGVTSGDNRDQVHSPSDVASISLEVSGVTSTPVVLSSPTPLSGSPRDPSNPLLYEMFFTNDMSADQGTYLGLVKVADSYMPGQNSAPSLNGKDGISRVDPMLSPLAKLFEIPEFATYAAFQIDVQPNTELPVCDIQTIPSNGTVSINHNITFDGSASHDPDGSVVLYEWDFDYNGTTFNADATGAVVQTQYSTVDDCVAALRVTDDMNAKSICTKPIHVTETPVIPDDFIQIDNVNFGTNVTIVEDYSGVLHAFYVEGASFTSQASNIHWSYSEDHGNTWQGQEKIYDTTGQQYHVVLCGTNAQAVWACATSGPIIYIAWVERKWTDLATFLDKVVVGEFSINNLNSPVLNYLTAFTEPSPCYGLFGVQLIATSQNELMLYYGRVQSWGVFVLDYKFAIDYVHLPEAITPTLPFTDNSTSTNNITNGHFTYVYHSTSPLFAVDSHDNIFFTISGNMQVSGSTPPPGLPDYSSNYGSAILRYNNSGDYLTGNNWTFVQHYGRSGMANYWDNSTQAIVADKNDNIHWVFEYETNGSGSWDYIGNYYMVYGTGPSTGQWNFTYTDPILPSLHEYGPNTTCEFLYASIDTNSQGEVWITYQDASDVPEIYYTYNDGSWHDPTVITVPPLDSGWYPYMFITSWDGMYTVFNDALTDGHPWLKAIDTL